ncbi:hypothetical protein RJ639_003400 [Escallonia herrerae]|uniref:Copper transport protein n=1 Tax=Escallonia herrerae TaxID=1293975 RepID=A0AA88W0N3_9ASTE|nr:hypothetical protein RJ639_003400 [Escallonia herrerae]
MPLPISNCTVNTIGMQQNLFWGKDVIIFFPGCPDNNLDIHWAVKPGSSPFAGALNQAAVYALRVALAYLVMLSVMSYNLGILILAVAGNIMGFFLSSSSSSIAHQLMVSFTLTPTVYWLPQEEVPHALTMRQAPKLSNKEKLEEKQRHKLSKRLKPLSRFRLFFDPQKTEENNPSNASPLQEYNLKQKSGIFQTVGKRSNNF